MATHLEKNVKVTRVSNAVAAGTSAVNCTSVDNAGYDGVIIEACFGTLTATQVTSLKAQGSNDNSSWSDLAGTSTGPLADGDSNKMLVLDVYKPTYRYIRGVVVRGTANAVVDSVVAKQYVTAKTPVSHDTSVSASKLVASPAAGAP